MNAQGTQSCYLLSKKFCFTLERKSILAYAIVLFVLWLPYIIAFFPGTMSWDTLYMIQQFYPGSGQVLYIPYEATQSWVPYRFSDHHPLFDTLLVGFFAYASDVLFGTWNVGLGAYMVLQCVAMALTFSVVCCYLSYRGIGPRGLHIACYLFFGLFPVFPLYGVSILKDSLFSWLFVLFFLLTMEIVLSKGRIFQKPVWVAAYIVLCLLLCLTKKTGIYVVVFENIFLLICFRQFWKPLISALIAAVALINIVLPLLIFPALNVVPGGAQEKYGPLFQQTAFYVVQHEEEITDDEREAIDKVLPYTQLGELYNPHNMDPVKFSFRWNTATDDDMRNYAFVWLGQGLKHPDTYISASWQVLSPFFNPMHIIDVYTQQGSLLTEGIKAEFLGPMEPVRSAILQLYSFLAGIPLINLAFSNVMYGFFIPLTSFVVVVCFSAKRKEVAPIYFLVLLAIGSYLIAPVAWSRYLLPLIYVAPLLVSLCVANLSNSDVRQDPAA